MHLTIDGYGSPQVFQDERFLREFLESYPSQIGMNKIWGPVVLRYVGCKPEDWGCSGFVMIAESHISLHTFVDKAFIHIDIFSCKEFDTNRVINDLQQKFQLTSFRACILKRGLEYNALAPLETVSYIYPETSLNEFQEPLAQEISKRERVVLTSLPSVSLQKKEGLVSQVVKKT